MRDMKRQPQKPARTRQNKRIRTRERKPIPWRRILHRTLRIAVFSCSGALVLVGGFFSVQLLLASELFRVEQISVQGEVQLRPEMVVALSDIRPGVNTFHLDLDLIGRRIAENPWVRSARVERIFPRQVVISVEERQAVAIINLGYLYYLDRSGEVFKVLDAGDSLDYPVITGFDPQQLQDKDRQSAADLKQIVSLLGELEKRQQFGLAQISEIHRDPHGSFDLFTLEGGVKVRMGRNDYGKKLDRLERIYAQLQPRLPILDYIDLNVDEKVIVRIDRPPTAAKG